jgi:site-specific recombinase XerD
MTSSIRAIEMYAEEFDMKAKEPKPGSRHYHDVKKLIQGVSDGVVRVFEDRMITRKAFTMDDLKSVIEEVSFQINNPGLPYNFRTLPDVFQSFMVEQSKVVGSLISKGTYDLRGRNLKTVQKVLEKLDYSAMPISYYETDHIEQIQLCMLEEGKKKSFVGRVMQVVNMTLKYAVAKKYAAKNPYEDLKKIRIDKTPNPIWLEPHELEAWWELDLTDNPVAEKIRDAFYFCSFTGLAIGDYELLNPKTQQKQIEDARSPRFIEPGEIVETRAGRMLMGRRKKTGTQYRVPLRAEVEEVIEKYGGLGMLPFNLPTSGKLLELIAKAAGVKKKKMSFHMARKTFANYLINVARIKPYYAIEIMGWKKIEEAAPYTRVSDETLASQLPQDTSACNTQAPPQVRTEAVERHGVFTIHRTGS